MTFANDPVAGRATRDLVRADDFAGSSFAGAHAVLAEAAKSTRRVRVGGDRVMLAHHLRADRARSQTGRAGRMPAVGALALVLRAVLSLA
jgi:hypothetical protein